MEEKIIIFNVGGAMSAYCEKGDKRILIDIGKNNEFSPVQDFLLPYFQKSGLPYSETKGQEKKFHIDQIIVSHPHKDHVSDIQSLDKFFYPAFVTTPNDNEGMEGDELLNRDLVIGDNEIDEDVKYFQEKYIAGRKPPLQSIIDGFEIYYMPPGKIEEEITLSDYTNNTSLVCIVSIDGHKIMLPGDIMKSGFERMMEHNVYNITLGSKTQTSFKKAIKKRGINVLIAPHHGLKSAFSTVIMNEIQDELLLVIIPEKISTEDSPREVDSRYYSGEYGSGIDIFNLETGETEKQGGVKTSVGHIIIGNGRIVKVSNNDNLVDAFLNL